MKKVIDYEILEYNDKHELEKTVKDYSFKVSLFLYLFLDYVKLCLSHTYIGYKQEALVDILFKAQLGSNVFLPGVFLGSKINLPNTYLSFFHAKHRPHHKCPGE